MKKSYQHIIKKSYTTPKIEEVEIDVAISLETPSMGPPAEEPPGPPKSAAQNQNTLDSAPKYPVEYRSETPFGGSTPIYE